MNDVHTRAKKGITLLMGRQIILQTLTFVGGVVLARVLTPAQFGLYGIATFLVTAFATLGDFGLAPSFIQRKNELTDRDLQVGFTLQQIMTTLIVLILMVAAPKLAAFYPKAPPETVWLVRGLAFSLYLTSWRSMSALQLERHLRYDRLAWIEVVETLSYQGLAVALALAGFGVWSFVWATLVRGLLGTTLVYLAAPWPIRLGYDGKITREILRFGVPFQLQAIINSIGGWITPALVGSMIGPQAVGYLTWASSNGKKPLLLVDNVTRVAFPHFSRIQDNQEEVERTVSRYLNFLLLPAGAWMTMIVMAGPSLVRIIYTSKWSPAVPCLMLFAMAMLLDVISWLVTITLNSGGKVNYATRIYVVRTVVNVGLSLVLIKSIGFVGVAVAYLAMMLIATFWLFGGLGQGALQRIMGSVAWIVAPIAVSLGAGWMMQRVPLPLAGQAIAVTLVTLGAYAVVAWATCPDWMKAMVTRRFATLRPQTAK